MTSETRRRVLIDATGARYGGGYTYLVNIVPRLCRMAPSWTFRLMLRYERLIEVLPRHANLELIDLPEVGIAERMRHTFFTMPRIAREWGADVFFSTGEVVPRKLPCPSIPSFRNANVFTYDVPPANLRDRLRFMALWLIARSASRHCEKIMFVSHDAAQWIGDSLGMPEERRAVIQHGIDTTRWAEAAPFSDHPRPYILSVSSIYNYKNFVRLIQAYRILAEAVPDAPDLIIIGDEVDLGYLAEMRAAREAAGALAERIHILGTVPYEQVQSYYKGARLFVFPSYLETFGHPLLEAMAAHVPVVATDMGSFREVAGDAALYVPHDDVPAIAGAMQEALRPEVASELARRGDERVREFDWDVSAGKLIALFEEVIAARGRA